VLAAVAFAVAALGAGSISLDHVLGIEWAGLEWAIAAALLGALGGLTVPASARIARRTQQPQPQTQTQTA
jgi:hypothetical protein